MLTLHHLGLLTQSLESTRQAYVRDFGAVEEATVGIASQQVRVCLLRLPDGTRLELVEPGNPQSTLARLCAQGVRPYHLAFTVADLDAAREHFAARGYRALPAFASELFEGRRCQFIFGPEQALIELVEAAAC